MNSMFKSVIIPYSDEATGTGNAWARLEQEYKKPEDDKANLSDLSKMLALVNIGESAFGHVENKCPYAEVVGDTIVVNLDFYVWPYALDLVYNLKADLGEISDGVMVEEEKSFDVVLQNNSHRDLLYIFDGVLEPEMPYFSSSGQEIFDPVITVDSSEIYVSPPVTTVLRAEGIATGFKHTITMTLVKAVPDGDYPVSNPDFKISGVIQAGVQYDYVEYPIIHSSEAIEETWTIDFTDDTSFVLYDSGGSSQGHGNVNEDFVTNFFTMRAAGWIGSATSTSYTGFKVTEEVGVNSSGYKIENLRNTIVLSWVDEKGKPKEDVLELAIPPCVEALLEACPGDENKTLVLFGEPKYEYELYFSTCTGALVEFRTVEQ